MNKVYLLKACYEHEGCSVLKAYSTYEKADEVKNLCEEHDKLEPIDPMGSDWDSEEYIEFDKQLQEWLSGSPVGGVYFCDYYDILEMEIE